MSDVKEALERVGRESAAEPAVPRLSIAVLPFANTSADPETEYFSDGLAEEIISALAQIQGLKVIGRAWRACWSRAS
jgi:TolB-like protein